MPSQLLQGHSPTPLLSALMLLLQAGLLDKESLRGGGKLASYGTSLCDRTSSWNVAVTLPGGSQALSSKKLPQNALHLVIST